MRTVKFTRPSTIKVALGRSFAIARTVSRGHRSVSHVFLSRHHSTRQPTSRQSPSRRNLFIDSVPTLLVPPLVFTGLLLSLWTYKCLMTILFQDKIIYMSYIGRSEKMETYTSDCMPVEWEQRNIKSLDGTKIALCVGSIPTEKSRPSRHVVICYFQGNGSSPPPRMPLLSNVLKSIAFQTDSSNVPVHFSILALSYRGYWKSDEK